MPADDIASFDAWFSAYYFAIDRQDLWAALYTIEGGLGDDRWGYARAALIARGERAVVAAIANPEALPEIIGKRPLRDEEMLYVARQAYASTYGGDIPAAPSVVIPGRAAWPADRLPPGATWDAEFLRTHFPTLYATYELPRLAAMPPHLEATIEHARFWELVDEARARAGGGDVDRIVACIDDVLAEGTPEQLFGFDRWLQSYHHQLRRNDLKAACRILLGSYDAEVFQRFVGGLVAGGEAVMRGATTNLDSLANAPPRGCDLFSVRYSAARRLKIMYPEARDTFDPIPGAEGWTPDWSERAPFEAALLRTRLPALAALRTPEALEGALDPDCFDGYERGRRAETLLSRAKDVSRDTSNDLRVLELLDEAVRWMPTSVETLGARGRAHVRHGNRDAAMADFDQALVHMPDARAVLFERAKLLLARGERDRALEDARHADALGFAAARAFLIEHDKPRVPKRVRHATFGEGSVVSVDSQSAKLVIDFAGGRKTLLGRFVEVLE